MNKPDWWEWPLVILIATVYVLFCVWAAASAQGVPR